MITAVHFTLHLKNNKHEVTGMHGGILQKTLSNDDTKLENGTVAYVCKHFVDCNLHPGEQLSCLDKATYNGTYGCVLGVL